MLKIKTRNGGTIEACAHGPLMDIHVKDASGNSVASVKLPRAEAIALLGRDTVNPR